MSSYDNWKTSDPADRPENEPNQDGEHTHTCQQCDKVIKSHCTCKNPRRMDWCSPNCRAAYDL